MKLVEKPKAQEDMGASGRPTSVGTGPRPDQASPVPGGVGRLSGILHLHHVAPGLGLRTV